MVIGISIIVTVKRQKKGRIIVYKTVAVNKSLNSVLPLALTVEVGLIY